MLTGFPSGVLTMKTKKENSGFSLVELSIVLVILGLLVGGVLAGQSLIRAAELRAVSTETSRYVAAVQTFRDKYFALPGDMPNATAFWGAEPPSNCPGDHTTPSTTVATCNGDGNGQLSWTMPAGRGSEAHRFWQHLANAGLIEGQFTGTQSAGACNGTGTCNNTIGVNAPRSRMSNAGWSVSFLGNVNPGDNYYFPGQYGNALHFGSQGNWTTNSALRPEEAWNIDTKADDGRPGTGSFTTWRNNAGFPNCTNGNDATAAYRLEVTSISCQFTIKTGF